MSIVKTTILNFLKIWLLKFSSALIFYLPGAIISTLFFGAGKLMIPVLSTLGFIVYVVFFFQATLLWSVLFLAFGLLIKVKKVDVIKMSTFYLFAYSTVILLSKSRELKNLGFFSKEFIINEYLLSLLTLSPMFILFMLLYCWYGPERLDLVGGKEQAP
jgi:hypothetical protein